MEFQLESTVVSADGADMGKIHRVIFDPDSAELKSIVIKRGVFLALDVVVPVEDIRAAAVGQVELRLTREELENLPEFVEADYTWPHEQWTVPYDWQRGAVMWPLGAGADLAFERLDTISELAHEAEERDLENAVVGRGSDVLALGGEKVGEVHNLTIDPISQKPSRLSLRRGFLFTEDVEIPSAWIESYDDGTVFLNVDKATVERLAL